VPELNVAPTFFDLSIFDITSSAYSCWCRCGHCKHLTPEYKKLGEAVAKDPKLKNSVVVAKVGVPGHQPDLLQTSISASQLSVRCLVTFRSALSAHCTWSRMTIKQLHMGNFQLLYLMRSWHVPRQVNADDHREIGERFGVRGFPTIKFFGRGKPVTAPEEYAPTREHL
jgi:thiol-disulfide isomerase/thioredoxin